MAELFISGYRSRCGACRKGANPTETHHVTRYDYGNHDGKGCGAEFTHLTTDLLDTDAVRRTRPDLPFAGIVGSL